MGSPPTRSRRFAIRAPTASLIAAALLPAVLPCAGLVACGGVARNAPAGLRPPSNGVTQARVAAASPPDSTLPAGLSPAGRRRFEWDHDGDPGADNNSVNAAFDRDDGEFRYYGRAAGANVRRAVTRLVARYYAAAAANDGAAACALVDAELADAFAAQRDARFPGSPAPAAGGCAAALAARFRHILGRSAADMASVRVIGVRVAGDRGLALLRLRSSQVRYIPVGSERGAWKIEALIDSEMG
jgi:hypothetical protein